MAKDKEDQSWRNLTEPWERLRWARLKKFGTATEAATHFQMQPHTYRAYERPPTSSKHTPIDYEHAFLFANQLGVRWEWMMRGEEPVWKERQPIDRIKEMIANKTEAQQEAIADAIAAILRTGSDG